MFEAVKLIYPQYLDADACALKMEQEFEKMLDRARAGQTKEEG